MCKDIPDATPGIVPPVIHRALDSIRNTEGRDDGKPALAWEREPEKCKLYGIQSLDLASRERKRPENSSQFCRTLRSLTLTARQIKFRRISMFRGKCDSRHVGPR